MATLRTAPAEAERARAAHDLGQLGQCGVRALGAAIREDPSYIVPSAALDALADLGGPGLAAVPDVIDATWGRNGMSPLNPDHVGDTLVRMGSGVIPYLVPYLRMNGPTSDEDTLRTAGFAATVLGRLGAASVPALVEALAIPEMRFGAVAALRDIGPPAAAAVPALVMAYEQDEHPEHKLGIIWALYRIGDNACASRELFERLSCDDGGLLSSYERENVVAVMLHKLKSCPR